MPHQCVRCNTFYEDGSTKILKEMTESSSANVTLHLTVGTESGTKQYIGYINTNF